jgi:pimeloyl-ACP methyl ester carboxylesterase
MSEKSNTAGSPTVVLVHGAFADASSWNGVIERLQAKGVQVTAPANPLRGISIDSAYIAGVLEETPGPIVAVGHLNSALVPLHYPAANGGEPAVEFAIDPEKFHDAFAADLPTEETTVMAATQRPVAELAFSEPSGAPAWKDLPSWAVVATGDKAAGADVIRSEAERAGATITDVEGSHVIMVSQPQAVTDVILEAVAAVG